MSSSVPVVACMALLFAAAPGLPQFAAAQAPVPSAGAVRPAVPPSVRPGTLTGSLVSPSNPGQRYAVYLPSTFDGETPAPILFVLDYRGRARVGADVFAHAAERFGWIVISSANSASDETPLGTVTALQTMWVDAHDLFPIDPRRIYLAGLSGTARTSTWLASRMPHAFTGVIGAAAGFAPDTPPSPDTDFLYFGTVGEADYNFWEMRALGEQLTALDRPHRIERFYGSHGWMPPALAMAAVEWMELRAMRAGTRPVSASFVDAMWAADLHAAATLEEIGQPHAELQRLQAMRRDYRGLRGHADLAAIEARAARLAAEPAAAADDSAHDRARTAHDARIAESMDVIARAFPVGAAAPATSVSDVVDALGLGALRATAASRDRARALEAQRLLAELEVQTGFYLPVEAMRANHDRRAAFYLEIARAINAEDPFAWYVQAVLHGRASQGERALDALRHAVRFGFRTLTLLEVNAAFDGIRAYDEFQDIIDQVRLGWELERGR